MAPADLVARLIPAPTASLVQAVAVFLLQTLAAWGAGDTVMSAFRVARHGDSRFMRPLLALAVGFGLIGQVLFLAGIAGDAYQAPFVGTLLAAFAVLAAFRIPWRTIANSWRPFEIPGRFAQATVLLTAVYLVLWWWVSLGFNSGSDVFNHHYLDVKVMLHEQHFALAGNLPSGLHHVSSYNPALARMLYLPGHLLADERAANMFHCLTAVMLVGAVYLLGRTLGSVRAGLLAVAIYLATSTVGYYPLEAQDYTLMAVFQTLAMIFLLTHFRDGSARALLLAGVLAGLMLSTKYYALPIAGLMTGAIVVWKPGSWRSRLGTAAVFGVVAIVVCSPWFVYNLVTYHDPLYPAFSNLEEFRFFRAVSWINPLSGFVVPSDTGFLLPTLYYYLSLFIPFDHTGTGFSLGVIVLIGLPCSIYCLVCARGSGWRHVNALFVFVLVSFLALHVVLGQTAFYKWALFPAVLYCGAFAATVERLRAPANRWFWTATMATAITSFGLSGLPGVLIYGPPAPAQEARWDEMTRYLNATVEPGAVITGTSIRGTYYLRPDLTGMRDMSRVSTDWPAEVAFMRRVGVKYMVIDPNQSVENETYFRLWSGLWRQLSPHDTSQADFIDDVRRRHLERDRQRAAFLQHAVMLVHQFPRGVRLYRLKTEAK